MGIEDIGSWDLDNSTWGGWGEVIGTVLVLVDFRSSPLRNLWQNYTFGPWTCDFNIWLENDFDSICKNDLWTWILDKFELQCKFILENTTV
nr:hypothetical protein [Tanacetum cinerariifolium]